MENYNDRIQQLLLRLEKLQRRQEEFSNEIQYLRIQIKNLQAEKWASVANEPEKKEEPIIFKEVETEKNDANELNFEPKVVKEKFNQFTEDIPEYTEKVTNLEKFIGENVLNKIGIIITIIGVSIGVKYSIDNNLISPVVRIILGYLSGIILLGFGVKLKENYENYSAVLVSGAITIMYFITYAAHSYYGLIPQVPAFIMMVLFTIFGVAAAIYYNRQVIAHIGLVGAYAVPFLLSNDSGNALVLFTYMTIINIGILVIAYKKYWKALYGAAFGLSWLIYFTWLGTEYNPINYFGVGLTFATVFFAIFYTMLLAYKVLRKEVYTGIDIALLCINTLVFYAFGCWILSSHSTGEHFLGIFTLINATIHCLIAAFLFRQKDIDKNLCYLIIGFVITFITIAIPVELDGNWVTMLWMVEAAVLFWIGRTKNSAIYEKLSYPVMFITLISLIDDWRTLYPYEYDAPSEAMLTPIFNLNFMNSLLCIIGFGFITKLFFDKKYVPALTSPKSKSFYEILYFALPTIFIVVVYFTFSVEIQCYWNQLFIHSEAISDGNYYTNKNYSFLRLKIIWLINYTMVFMALLSFVNIKKIKNEILAYINLSANVLTILVFLINGLVTLKALRYLYINQLLGVGYSVIVLRYISYAFVAVLLVMSYRYLQAKIIKRDLKIGFDCVLHFTILCILSSELINWLDMAASIESDKLGLSILWGIYALSIIILGIWKRQKHLRIMAILLFGITLVKLFFYDIAHLPTLSKTIVFVSLGTLLLIISFLYNKYKSKIFEEA
jgi:uncharacterized membrane protein